MKLCAATAYTKLLGFLSTFLLTKNFQHDNPNSWSAYLFFSNAFGWIEEQMDLLQHANIKHYKANY